MPAGIEPQEVAAASGACLAIPLRRWRELGGFPAPFFLYHEDIDLSMRLRLAGGRVGIEPAAVVDHDYEFAGRAEKWRWLERNRWAFLIRVYPARLLVLLAPALLLTELALIPVALAGGWGRAEAARPSRTWPAGCRACCASGGRSRRERAVDRGRVRRAG